MTTQDLQQAITHLLKEEGIHIHQRPGQSTETRTHYRITHPKQKTPTPYWLTLDTEKATLHLYKPTQYGQTQTHSLYHLTDPNCITKIATQMQQE